MQAGAGLGQSAAVAEAARRRLVHAGRRLAGHSLGPIGVPTRWSKRALRAAGRPGPGSIPAVGEQKIARQWCGLEAQSFDGIPFIGAVPSFERLTVATGCSGHGFAIAPASGRAIADQLAGRASPGALRPRPGPDQHV